MNAPDLERLDVIIPNLSWRYSGVTSTNRMNAPRVALRLDARWLGPDAPEEMVRLSAAALLGLRTRDPRRPVIWHARRNVEMVVGFALRALGWPLRLVFTSAAQRRHKWFTRWLIARMDAVIATSEASASYLDRPATVILHGVDTELYRPPPDRVAALGAAGLPGRYGIGCFGRVRAQKGTDVFVQAICNLLPRYPDFTAIVVGPVTVEQMGFAMKLKALVRRTQLSDRVRFLGEVPKEDVPAWYQRTLIYAFTSRNEGFGLTLLEAMAAGNAVVAARAGAAEHVVHDGETGLLVPPGDVAALAAALEALMRDPPRAAEMGRKARARVVDAFGVDAEAERIARFYRGVLARPGN